MKNDKWKYKPPYFYREKEYSIFGQIGHQSLKKLQAYSIKVDKPKRNMSLQNSFEKLPPIEKTQKKFYYNLPKLEQPEAFKLLTVDEYRQILERRIRDDEQKKNQQQQLFRRWELPKIDVPTQPSKFSFKPYLQNENLRVQIEQFQLE